MWTNCSGSVHPDSTFANIHCTFNAIETFPLCTNRYQTLAVATDANTKEDIGNKKVSGKKLTVIIRRISCICMCLLVCGVLLVKYFIFNLE